MAQLKKAGVRGTVVVDCAREAAKQMERVQAVAAQIAEGCTDIVGVVAETSGKYSAHAYSWSACEKMVQILADAVKARRAKKPRTAKL